GARPYYNNVTATFIDRIIAGEAPEVDPHGRVELVHAGAAADAAIEAAKAATGGVRELSGRPMAVAALRELLVQFHRDYEAGLFPDISHPSHVALFNSDGAAQDPDGVPGRQELHRDARGTLFEAAKGGGGGQVFLS